MRFFVFLPGERKNNKTKTQPIKCCCCFWCVFFWGEAEGVFLKFFFLKQPKKQKEIKRCYKATNQRVLTSRDQLLFERVCECESLFQGWLAKGLWIDQGNEGWHCFKVRKKGGLGGGFKNFNLHPYLGKIPFWLIFFKWVETTNLGITVIWHLLVGKQWRGPHVSPPPPETPRTLHETFQDGWTAAMRAAQYGHVNILRYFLDTGASKDSSANMANTETTRRPDFPMTFEKVGFHNRIIFSYYKDEGNCAANKKSITCPSFWFFRVVILFKKSRLVIVWSNLVKRCEYNSPRKTTVWPFQSLPGFIIQQGNLDAKALVVLKIAKSGCFFSRKLQKNTVWNSWWYFCQLFRMVLGFSHQQSCFSHAKNRWFTLGRGTRSTTRFASNDLQGPDYEWVPSTFASTGSSPLWKRNMMYIHGYSKGPGRSLVVNVI